MVLSALIAGGIAGAARNITGWLENSLADGEISSYEWGQLASTIVQSLVLTLSGVYGLGLDATQAAGLSVLASVVISAVKKAGTKY